MFKEIKKSLPTDTLIGQGTSMEGKITCDAGIRIEGQFQGDIECKGDVVIGESGVATSSITAHDVTIAGIVNGDVTTRGRLTITATGQLHGNLNATSLIIQEGGIFSGKSDMMKHQTVKPKPLTAEAADPKDTKSENSDKKDQKARQAV
ncbi:polymer-forming cytoskeletal protein [Paenibacillus tarimensis]